MKKTQKYVASSSEREGYFIIDNREAVSMPLFCDICSFVMRNSNDATFYKKFGCCEECGMTFAEPRSTEWEEGWRPDNDILVAHKEKMRNKSLQFKN